MVVKLVARQSYQIIIGIGPQKYDKNTKNLLRFCSERNIGCELSEADLRKVLQTFSGSAFGPHFASSSFTSAPVRPVVWLAAWIDKALMPR
jgi:hypothetical protein